MAEYERTRSIVIKEPHSTPRSKNNVTKTKHDLFLENLRKIDPLRAPLTRPLNDIRRLTFLEEPTVQIPEVNQEFQYISAPLHGFIAKKGHEEESYNENECSGDKKYTDNGPTSLKSTETGKEGVPGSKNVSQNQSITTGIPIIVEEGKKANAAQKFKRIAKDLVGAGGKCSSWHKVIADTLQKNHTEKIIVLVQKYKDMGLMNESQNEADTNDIATHLLKSLNRINRNKVQQNIATVSNNEKDSNLTAKQPIHTPYGGAMEEFASNSALTVPQKRGKKWRVIFAAFILGIRLGRLYQHVTEEYGKLLTAEGVEQVANLSLQLRQFAGKLNS